MKYIAATQYDSGNLEPVLDGDDSVKLFDSPEQVKMILGGQEPPGSLLILTCDEAILKFLPQGSGFDDEWSFENEYKNGKLLFFGWYHNMNDNGCYDGWTRIRLIVDPHHDFDFDVAFAGNEKYRWAMNGYVEDTIEWRFSENGFRQRDTRFYNRWAEHRQNWIDKLKILQDENSLSAAR